MNTEIAYFKKITVFLALSLISAAGLSAQGNKVIDHQSLRAFFAPLPDQANNPNNVITPEKVSLGKKLFMDQRFSLDRDLSCNSCHNLNTFGVDNEPTSTGHKGQLGGRNSPSVYNAALLATQFWDGRAADVEAQALGPVLNPVEMGMPSAEEVIKRIKDDSEYVAMFKAAFKDQADAISFENFGKAIGAFERTLLTPGRFDQYLKGDNKALSAAELKGLLTFRDSGCTTCHMGSTVGGQMFQKLGIVKPYPTKDLGRYEVTKNEADKFVFRVPSLRNVAKTAPYFHDGSVKTLEEAIVLMARHQLGRELSKEQAMEIATFLGVLTGDVKK